MPSLIFNLAIHELDLALINDKFSFHLCSIGSVNLVKIVC